jgi:transcriptional regulator with XRE-family HTH domain
MVTLGSFLYPWAMSTSVKASFSSSLQKTLKEENITANDLCSRLEGEIPLKRLTPLLSGKVTPSIYEAYLIAKSLNISLDMLFQ